MFFSLPVSLIPARVLFSVFSHHLSVICFFSLLLIFNHQRKNLFFAFLFLHSTRHFCIPFSQLGHFRVFCCLACFTAKKILMGNVRSELFGYVNREIFVASANGHQIYFMTETALDNPHGILLNGLEGTLSNRASPRFLGCQDRTVRGNLIKTANTNSWSAINPALATTHLTRNPVYEPRTGIAYAKVTVL